MKVVLLKDVKNTGRAGSVIECASGHALNFLIPRGLAKPATDANVKQAEMLAKQAITRKELDAKLIEERIAALAEEKVQIVKKANEKGHLYDAVGVSEIASAAQLPEEAIQLEKPIKETGEFQIPISTGSAFGSITISVEVA